MWHFFVHIAVGTLLFALIFTPAVGLDRLVHALIEINISKYLVWIVQFAEYALVIIDTLLFVIFLLKTAYRFAREL